MVGVLSLSSVGCKDESNSGSATNSGTAIDSNTTSSIGMCQAPAPTLNAEGRFVRATLSQVACAKMQVCLDPSAWQNLPQNKYIPGIDVVILFDVTGSMSPYIKAMIQNIEQLMDNLSNLSPSVRIGLASFRDFADRGGSKGDLPYMFNAALTSDVSVIKSKLSTLKATGGGDAPESLATAIRAAVDGKDLPKYFSSSDMQWQNDPSRIKIVLGITDAADKKDNLPTGAATLQEAAELMKSQGILFLGIGRKLQAQPAATTATVTSPTITSVEGSKTTTSPSTTRTIIDLTSYEDLAYLARETRAIVSEPGIDLDGDGKTDKFGEVKPGEPAVLLMNSSGQLEGSSPSVSPTRVLADAITQMVVRVRPFQFNLVINSAGRVYSPTTNVVSVPPNTTTQVCFSLVKINPYSTNQANCSQVSEMLISSDEELNGASVDASALKVKLDVDLTCNDFLPATNVPPVVNPDPTPDTNAGTPPAKENLPWLPPGVVDDNMDELDDITGLPYM